MRTTAVKAACFAWLVGGLVACGSDQQPLEVKASKAEGSVGGVVLNAATREPLAGAKIALVAGGIAATPVTTGADGSFTFTKVSAGDVVVMIDIEGYLSATLHGTLPGAAQYPVDNTVLTFGPIALVPATGTFQAILQFEDGSPAGGLTLTARTNLRFYDYAESGAGVGYGQSQVSLASGTTDAAGLVMFTGLPDFFAIGEAALDLVTVIVPPIAGQTGDPALYKYPGGSFAYHMLAVGAATPVIFLRQPTPVGLAVVASSIPALEGAPASAVPAIVPRSGPIWITFNQPLDATNTKVTVLDELGLALNSQPTVTFAYDTMQIAFTPALPEEPGEYNLIVHAVAAVGDHLMRTDLWAPFFTPIPAAMLKPTLVRETVGTEDWIHLTFHEPIGGIPGSMLSGANCVIFTNINLGATSTTIGDEPGETGNASCIGTQVFYSEEQDPAGFVSASGYNRKWKFALPLMGPAPGTQIPAGTPFQLVFGHVADPTYTMKRVNGQAVPDFVGTTLGLLLP
ncbi:MAG TPA: carboxypeptidase-like regulatory domain-containing protein [Polyangia bacterium]|jgi:hypothetical protein